MALITRAGQYGGGNPLAGNLLTLSATGNTDVVTIPMKYQIYQAAGISLLVNLTSGASLTAGVQVSNDPLAYTNPSTALWNFHDTLQNLTASKNSSIIYPVYALRLNCSAWTSGTVTLQIGIFDYSL